MANWPFIKILIKGKDEDLEQIKRIISKNKPNQNTEIFIGSFSGYNAEHSEWKKEYQEKAKIFDYDTQVFRSDNLLTICLRLKHGPDDNFYEFLKTASQKFGDCFFYSSWFDVYNNKCGYFFGFRGEIVYQSTYTVEMDDDNNIICESDGKTIVLKSGKEINRSEIGGYNHMHPINYIIKNLIFDTENHQLEI